MNYINILKAQLNSIAPLDDIIVNDMIDKWKYYEVARKQTLTIQGDTEKYAYLVLEGVQRIFTEHNSKEATLIFSYPHSFAGVLDSFILQYPSNYNFETITTSKFLRIHINDFNEMANKHQAFDKWIQKGAAIALSGTLVRYKELLLMSAEEKFRTLLNRSPQVLNLIPHKYLASYIGVDPTTFSRLLSSVRL